MVGVEQYLKVSALSSYGFEDLEEKDELINQTVINAEAICRTASATRGPLIMLLWCQN